jgi:hypothetical protein
VDNSSLILSELQALRAEFNLHAQRTGERLSSLETDMHALVGNGQPGRVRLLEMAATRLERWATCPFKYFLQDVLGVDEVENPEAALQITPLDLGNLFHDVLERFIVEVLARPPAQQPEPDAEWSAADHARIAGWHREFAGRASVRATEPVDDS